MRPLAWSLGIFVLVSFVALPTAHAKGALFFEKVLLTDEASDFANGALDIEAVYVSELYPFDPDQDEAYDRIILRIEPRSLSDMGTCQVPSGTDGSFTTVCMLRFDVRFEVAGVAQHLWAVLDAPGKRQCCPVDASNTHTVADGTSVRMALDRPTFMMHPGSVIEKLFVTSAFVAGEQTQAGDRAPGDNENMPYDARPELEGVFAPPYTLEGTYEFFTLDIEGGPHRDSVGGQAVEFNVAITPTAHVVDDTVRFLFDIPGAWSLTPSRGTSGVDPRGLITGLSEGTTAEMGLSVSSRDLVQTGETYTILMHVHSSTQGYKMVPLTVRVTGPTIEDPDYLFRWQEATNLHRGKVAAFRFDVVDAQGVPRTGLPIDVAVHKDGKRVNTVPAIADGTSYKLEYSFPEAGDWVLDARVTNLQPSPHSAITVHVDAAKGVPGPGPILVLVLVALVALARARLPTRP